MKKNVKLIAAFMLLAAVLAGCASMQVELAPQYVYDGSKDLYPAICDVVMRENNKFKDAEFESIDIVNNTYVIKNVQHADGLNLVKFTLTVQLAADGTLKYSLSDCYTKPAGSGAWSYTSKFSSLFDFRPVENVFNTYLPECMNDEQAYNDTKKALFSNPYFITSNMDRMTSVQKEAFAEKISDTQLTFTFPVNEVSINSSKLYPDYKYKITAFDEDHMDLTSITNMLNMFVLYTNDEVLGNASKGQRIEFSGYLVAYPDGFNSMSYVMTQNH